ncbi:hypothetical protein ACWD0Z_35135 [Streptomyces sp. NPDC003007]
MLITGLAPAEPGPALTTEHFASVLAVLKLPGDPRQFLAEAVRTTNEEFAGTLGVNLIAHPSTMSVLSPALDEAVSELCYGTIALNAWIGVGHLTATTTASWDAFPGHTPDDVQSGIGVVHNALLLDGPERTVVRSPFHPAPQALLHGVQLDRAGTLGTDAARPSLPDRSGSIRLTPQPGSALDGRRAGPGSGQTHRQRDRAGSAHGPAHGVPNCLSGRALTSPGLEWSRSSSRCGLSDEGVMDTSLVAESW